MCFLILSVINQVFNQFYFLVSREQKEYQSFCKITKGHRDQPLLKAKHQTSYLKDHWLGRQFGGPFHSSFVNTRISILEEKSLGLCFVEKIRHEGGSKK
jgi:hypothetical protein